LNRIGIVVAACILVALVAFGWLHQRTMIAGLPPREVCENGQAALIAAGEFARAQGGTVIAVLGTGSMAPYIPAAPAGSDPLATLAAYAVTTPATFADIRPGSLCLYRAEWSPSVSVIHQAAQRDGDGWVMSGLHNARSEASWRVTPANFIGITARVFVW